MRNLFDQYTQPENRLTHALLASLDADRRLLREFIRWAEVGVVPRVRLAVLEQSLPGEPAYSSGTQEEERKGLPDGWIYDGAGWALLIESKVSAFANADQIRRHFGMAARRGFPKARLLWLTVLPVKHKFGVRVVSRTWAELYEWLVQQGQRSEWARRAADYFEVAEVQADMKEQLKEGTLTRFSGIPFNADHPYSYSQAKRILGLLRDRLAARADLRRKLNVDPKHAGRGAIKGKQATVVWDFVALKDLKGNRFFTQHPHLTLGISDRQLEAYVTIPNNISGRLRKKMLGKGYEDFAGIIQKCTERMEASLKGVPGAKPFFIVVQRRYPSMSAAPIHDLRMTFDPRTAFEKKGVAARKQPKYQPEWLRAADQALRNRRSNLQFQIGAAFPYDSCEAVRRASIDAIVAKTWIACRPLIEAGRESKGSK